MEQKTQIHAENGKQEITITRQFHLPVEMLFKAYADAAIVAQWMGTKVLKLESHTHGSFVFETTDPKGNKHRFSGVIHEYTPNQKIVRTYEMENTPFSVWLEYVDFEPLTEDTSRLKMHVVYQSVEQRDQILQLPFAQGINWAHNRLQEVAGTLK